MTDLPASTERRLGLVTDLDVCVGCHACVIACKGWNDHGAFSPLSDADPYGPRPAGAFPNRVHSYEITPEEGPPQIVHFPKSCMHCDTAPCVTVCPTGASYKRQADGIVLVNEATCIGCGLCAWACPYGARELDPAQAVMKTCTLCVDRLENPHLPEEDREPACVRTCPSNARHFGDLSDPDSAVSRMVAERGGYALSPEQNTRPTNRYLPPRERDEIDVLAPLLAPVDEGPRGFLGWLDRALDRI